MKKMLILSAVLALTACGSGDEKVSVADKEGNAPSVAGGNASAEAPQGVNAAAGAPQGDGIRIDGSNPEAFLVSQNAMIENLPTDKQQLLNQTIFAMGYYANDPSSPAAADPERMEAQFRQSLHGKTADEIIAMGAPAVQRYRQENNVPG